MGSSAEIKQIKSQVISEVESNKSAQNTADLNAATALDMSEQKVSLARNKEVLASFRQDQVNQLQQRVDNPPMKEVQDGKDTVMKVDEVELAKIKADLEVAKQEMERAQAEAHQAREDARKESVSAANEHEKIATYDTQINSLTARVEELSQNAESAAKTEQKSAITSPETSNTGEANNDNRQQGNSPSRVEDTEATNLLTNNQPQIAIQTNN